MKIPKLHSDRLNEIVNEISSIDDATTETFKRMNDAVTARAKKACDKIDVFISDIKEILKTNECGKVDLVLGRRKFILHSSVKDVYIAIVGEDDEVKCTWPPKDRTKLNEAMNLKPIACKNDALENLGKVEYLEENARCGEALLKDFISAYKEHVSCQLEKLEAFIEKADLET